jgi:hypothetical protein
MESPCESASCVSLRTALSSTSLAHRSPTWAAFEQPMHRDVNSGDGDGCDVWPRTYVWDLSLCPDAAQAYYRLIAGRLNCLLFYGAATKPL